MHSLAGSNLPAHRFKHCHFQCLALQLDEEALERRIQLAVILSSDTLSPGNDQYSLPASL